jgi:hypothetical protein
MQAGYVRRTPTDCVHISDPVVSLFLSLSFLSFFLSHFLPSFMYIFIPLSVPWFYPSSFRMHADGVLVTHCFGCYDDPEVRCIFAINIHLCN